MDGDDADGELDANSEARLHALDPESQVGRGVGGVFFSRNDLMDLSAEGSDRELQEEDPGRGGRKLQRRLAACVHPAAPAHGDQGQMSIQVGTPASE